MKWVEAFVGENKARFKYSKQTLLSISVKYSKPTLLSIRCAAALVFYLSTPHTSQLTAHLEARIGILCAKVYELQRFNVRR